MVLSIFITVLFYFFSGINNGTDHWKLWSIPWVVALMLSSGERGILNQEESDAKNFSTILKSFQGVRSEMLGHISGQFLE